MCRHQFGGIFLFMITIELTPGGVPIAVEIAAPLPVIQ